MVRRLRRRGIFLSIFFYPYSAKGRLRHLGFFIFGMIDHQKRKAKKESSLTGKTLLVVHTGGPKKRFTLQRLKKLGVTLVMLNKEKNWAENYVDHWILADTNNHSECLNAIKSFFKINRDVVVDGALTFWEESVLLTSKIIDRFNFIGIPYSVSKNIRNKYLFRETCATYGLPVPRHQLIQSEAALSALGEDMPFPLVLKPIYGSSSAFVVKVENKEELMESYRYAKSQFYTHEDCHEWEDLSMMVEEYIDGDEVDMDILVQNGKIKFYSISDNYQTREPFFVETGQAIPSSLPEQDQRALIEMAEETLEKVGVQNGCIHFEAKSTKRGPVPIEVNLRMGGDEVYSFVKGAWGVDLIEYAAKVACGIYSKVEKPAVPKKYIVGEYFLADNSGVLSELDIPDTIEKQQYVEEFHFYKEIGDPIFIPPDGYDYLGWLTVSGENSIDAEDNMESIRKRVSYKVAKFASDSSIGKTLRGTRFSSAVLKKNLIVKASKQERFRRIALKNQRGLRVGILGNGADSNHAPEEQEIAFVASEAQKTLQKIGYATSFFDLNDPEKAFHDIKASSVDLIFNLAERVHGSGALEPQAAAMLDILQIPYTGSDSFSLALCMDKIRMKKILSYHSIPTPKWDYVYDLDDDVDKEMEFPLIVKPANSDNSIGITKDSVVTSAHQLKKQIRFILEELKNPVLIEEFIAGDEYDVSILGNYRDDLRVLPLSRYVYHMPEGGWSVCSYEMKWENHPVYNYKHITIQRPVKNISKRLEALITEISLDTYRILGCRDYGRVELRVDKDGNPFVIEINPNPCLNPDSSTVLTAKVMGMEYGDVLEEIIRVAIRRYNREKA